MGGVSLHDHASVGGTGGSSSVIKARRRPKKAILAVAASMLTAAHSMLRDGVDYRDLGPHSLDQRDRTKAIKRRLRRLSDFGCDVAMVKAA